MLRWGREAGTERDFIMKKSVLAVTLALAVGSLLSTASAGTLKVGATPVPHAEILEHVAPALKAQGVDLQVIEFNDYVQPNLACDDGELDANFFQHKPYLDVFVQDHGVDLVAVAGVHIEPMGIYSNKIKDLKELKKGDKVAIPNDPTNGGRALLLLATAGIIKVPDLNDVTVTVLDITENPLNLEFAELEAAQLPRALPDVTCAVINTNYAMPAGLNPLKDALYIENADSPYVNILVANQESANTEDMKALVKALTSEDTAEFIKTKYQGAIVPVGGAK